MNHWIFQSSPRYYVMEDAIQNLSINTFCVNQNWDEIELYDKVIFWVSGFTEAPGIIGHGTILSNPAVIPTSKVGYQFFAKEKKKEIQRRVWVTCIPFASKTFKNDVIEKYGELPVIKNPRSTNYRLEKKIYDKIIEDNKGEPIQFWRILIEEINSPINYSIGEEKIFLNINMKSDFGEVLNIDLVSNNVLLNNFINKMNIGDIFIVSSNIDDFSVIGQVKGEYKFIDLTTTSELQHSRDVKWLRYNEIPIPWDNVYYPEDRNEVLNKLKLNKIKFNNLCNYIDLRI